MTGAGVVEGLVAGAGPDKAAMMGLLARAVGNLPDAVLITDGEPAADGQRHIVFVNAAFTTMTGYTFEEAVGGLPDITIGEATDREALRRIQEARRALVPIRVELLKYRKDRSTFWVELDVVPVLDAAGRCTHWLGIMRDITARRDALVRLFETERMAAVGGLASGVAHEINSPLAYVLMNLSFVREELPALGAGGSASARAEVADALDEIEQGIQRVARIVKDLRAFSRIEGEAGTSEVASLLESAVNVARAGMPNVAAVDLQCAPDLPPVRCEPKRLSQVFLNLVVNALDAIPPSRAPRAVTLRAEREGGAVVVTIADEGEGIPAAVLPHVFDPFFTTKPAGTGTGLGLTIAQAIVRAAGGRLDLASEPGRGTTVRVELPISGASASVPPGALHGPGAPARPLRVLIVEDDELVARSLRRFVGNENEVVTCVEGRAALAVLEQRRDFDLVLCDLTMPGMGGAELHARVASRWPGFEDRFVILSGGATSEAAQRLLARPAVRRLDKPVDLVALRSLLASLGG